MNVRTMKVEIKYIVNKDGSKEFNAISNGHLALPPKSFALTVCAHDDEEVACGTHVFPQYNKGADSEILMWDFVSETLLTGLKGDK